jgi:hypothetical protein
VRLEVTRLLPDKQAAWLRTQEVLAPFPDSPHRQDAVRIAADLLGLPAELQAGLAPKASIRTGVVSAKVLDADLRREQDALAGVIANPDLVPSLAELTPDHFDLELHRRVREHLVLRGQADEDVVGVLAELDARAANEAIDAPTAKELLLRLRERSIRRELTQCDDPERIKELQVALGKIREVIGGLV